MREWCACGAAVRSWRYKRVLEWRKDHHCPSKPEEPRESNTFSDTHIAYQDETPRIGFYPTEQKHV